MAKIFISYRHDDAPDMTERIFERLVGEFGKDTVFMDVVAAPFGVPFRNTLAKRYSRPTFCS